MIVGYVRISAADQNTARQDVLMIQYGVEKVYTDILSGKNTDRPELHKMLEFLREGDTVVVESVSRLARSTKDFLTLLERIRKKGAGFRSIKERFDTSTSQGQFCITIFAALAELERATILSRQAEGIRIAKAEGRYKGKKPKRINTELFKDLYYRSQNGEIKLTYMAKRLGVSRSTLYKYIKNYKEYGDPRGDNDNLQ